MESIDIAGVTLTDHTKPRDEDLGVSREGATAESYAANSPNVSRNGDQTANKIARSGESKISLLDRNVRVQHLKVGDFDPHGDKVDCILASSNLYVIYNANKLVRYQVPSDHIAERLLRGRVAPLGGLRASIDSLRLERPIDEIEDVRAAREVAWALGEAFEDEGEQRSEQPKQILMRVDDRLRSLVKSYYRKRYVIANLGAVAAIGSLLLATAILSANSPAIQHYASYGILGGVGAFLSVIVGIKSIDLDMNLGRWEYAFAGATRILIGVIGASIVALALDAGLFDPTFGHNTKGGIIRADGLNACDAMYYILSVIGGFSETLVPNLLRRGDETNLVAATQKATKGPIVKDFKP